VEHPAACLAPHHSRSLILPVLVAESIHVDSVSSVSRIGHMNTTQQPPDIDFAEPETDTLCHYCGSVEVDGECVVCEPRCLLEDAPSLAVIAAMRAEAGLS
jgi:hypothetical protein